ncbi:TPA: PssE/Cps14G family polysaccharide biosynthesis glycosyltransferase [Vibrio parahaemolyticus]
MKYLITVGTTSFDSLVQYLDELGLPERIEMIFQIANGKYVPRNYPYFRFSKELWSTYNSYNIITHCGAGTVYYLLETERKFITVPNTERVDKHQLDLATYIEKNNYALVAYDFCSIRHFLLNDTILVNKLTSYKKEAFFKRDEILEIINGRLQ